MRILEVGAGTGATTAARLEHIPTTPLQYRFTGVSRFFIKRAARQFAQHPSIAFDLLDIDRPPVEQGFEARSFDIIVAANVLHNSKHIDQEQSLQSIDKIAVLLKAERGQLWINHDSAQSATIPHAPQYLQ